MGFTNSPLVDYTRLAPENNHYGARNHVIDTITPHCVVGQCTVEGLGSVFASPWRGACSNYGIGYDGRKALFCEEKNASGCSSSKANDERAITIEVASDTFYPYAVTEKAYASLIELIVDICKRNGIKKLLWNGNSLVAGQVDKQNMTAHKWFAATACPGEYLYSRFGDIAAKVNAQLTASEPKTETPKQTNTSTSAPAFKVGDTVKLANNAVVYGESRRFADFVYGSTLYVREVPESGDRIVISTQKTGAVTGAVAAKYLSKVSASSGKQNTATQKPATNTAASSGSGTSSFKVGDTVKIASNAVVYGGSKRFADFVYNSVLYVREVPESGDRIVISTQKTGAVTGAVAAKYLSKVSASSGKQNTATQKPAANTSTPAFKVGDTVKIASNAVIYGENRRFADFVYGSTLYVREVPESGDRIVISTQKTGAITGAVAAKYLSKV